MTEFSQELKATYSRSQTPLLRAAYDDPHAGFDPFVAPSVRLDAHEARSVSSRRRFDDVVGSPSFDASFSRGDQTARARDRLWDFAGRRYDEVAEGSAGRVDLSLCSDCRGRQIVRDHERAPRVSSESVFGPCLSSSFCRWDVANLRDDGGIHRRSDPPALTVSALDDVSDPKASPVSTGHAKWSRDILDDLKLALTELSSIGLEPKWHQVSSSRQPSGIVKYSSVSSVRSVPNRILALWK